MSKKPSFVVTMPVGEEWQGDNTPDHHASFTGAMVSVAERLLEQDLLPDGKKVWINITVHDDGEYPVTYTIG